MHTSENIEDIIVVEDKVLVLTENTVEVRSANGSLESAIERSYRKYKEIDSALYGMRGNRVFRFRISAFEDEDLGDVGKMEDFTLVQTEV